MTRRWSARVFVTGQWCEFGPEDMVGDAIATARRAWDELARHHCRPHFVVLDETHHFAPRRPE